MFVHNHRRGRQFQSHKGLILTHNVADLFALDEHVSIPQGSDFNAAAFRADSETSFVSIPQGSDFNTLLKSARTKMKEVSIPQGSDFNHEFLNFPCRGFERFQSHKGLILTNFD